MNAARPLPEPSELTAGFWDAAHRRTLVRPVCTRCERSFFTPQIACPRCLSEAWSYEPSSGLGVVYSATVVHRAPFPGFDAPYELAMVDLEEGWTMLTEIVGTDGSPTPIGARVTVDWLDAGAVVLPVFRRTA